MEPGEKREEKSVEYIELIYDLIFVYMVGRNNSLLEHVTNGFVEPRVFFTYLMSTLVIIQIWSFTSYYINMYGRNGIRDHVFLFINMYMLYFVGQSTRADWGSYQVQYNVCWGLILLNIAAQYIIELRHHRYNPVAQAGIAKLIVTLITEASVVFLSIPVYRDTGVMLAPLAIFLGMILLSHGNNDNIVDFIDFAHLSERTMLFVVFSLGETIVTISEYFEGPVTPRLIYFSVMAFLIVAGMFISYEILYNEILDRQMRTDGQLYMFVHILLIFAINNITVALSFMRDENVSLAPKEILLVLSFLLYYISLFTLEKYSRKRCRAGMRFYIKAIVLFLIFAVLMYIYSANMVVNIFISVIFVFLVCFLLWMSSRVKRECAE